MKIKLTDAQFEGLKHLREELVKFNELAQSGQFTTKRKTMGELQTLIDNADSFLEALKGNKNAVPARKTSRYILNVLKGIQSGIDDGSVGTKTFKANIDKLISDAIEGNKQTVSGIDTQLDAAADSSDEDVNPNASRHDNFEQRLDAASGEHKKLLNKYASHVSRVPAKLRHSFDIIQMPIVAVFEDYNLLAPQNLKKLGIKHKSLEGLFSVLEDQILLVFDKNDATTYKKMSKTGRESVRKAGSGLQVVAERSGRRQGERQKLIQNYINHTLDELINPRSRVKYSLVSVQFHTSHKNRDIMFAWIMDQDTLRRLHRITTDNQGIRGSWGFPWDFDSVVEVV